MFLCLAIVGMLTTIFAKINIPQGLDIGISLTAIASFDVDFMKFC